MFSCIFIAQLDWKTPLCQVLLHEFYFWSAIEFSHLRKLVTGGSQLKESLSLNQHLAPLSSKLVNIN